MESFGNLFLISLLLSYFGCCSSLKGGGELATRYSPAVRQRLSDVWKLLLPVPDDLLAQMVQRYIPVEAESDTCRNHSNYLLESLLRGDIWALRMLDAASKRGPGLLDGQLIDMGNYRQCLAVEEPGLLFTSQYCTVETKGILPQSVAEHFHSDVPWNWPFPLDNMIFSLCIPSSCSKSDVTAHIDRSLAGINASASSNVYCSTADPMPFRIKDYIALSVFSIIVLLTFASTGYDLCGNSNQVVSAFSLTKNFKSLMDTRKSDVEISCLNGLRVIFIATVVMLHRFRNTLMLPQYSIMELYEVYNTILPQVNEITPKAVDGFFLMSGVVLSYSFFRKNMDEYKFKLIRFYIDRYFRLTPLLAVIILYYSTLLVHLSRGPIWLNVAPKLETSCCTFWWAGLFQVTNIAVSQCVAQSWYVSCDFQLYLLSPLLLLPLLSNARLGLIMLGFAAASSAVTTTYQAYREETGIGYAMSLINEERNTLNFTFEGYTGIQYNIPPFAIGIALGYLINLIKAEKMEFKPSKAVLVLGWTASLGALLGVCGAIMVVASPYHQYSPWLDPLCIGFSSVFLSAGLSWVIFACHFGYGGFVNQFLSWPGFRPLGKLVFSVFLVHMIIIYGQILSIQEPWVLSLNDYMFFLSGDLILSYLLALVTHLFVEAPCRRLATYMLSGNL